MTAVEEMGEATVPAEQPATGQAARVSAPDVDEGRPGHHQGAPRQGSRQAVRLNDRVHPVSDRATFASLRRAKRARRGLITVAFVDSPPPPRVAFSISRKVGGAVRRNRLRRRLRALARHTDLRSGAWLVSASPGAAEAPFPELAGWWDAAVEALRPVGTVAEEAV